MRNYVRLIIGQPRGKHRGGAGTSKSLRIITISMGRKRRGPGWKSGQSGGIDGAARTQGRPSKDEDNDVAGQLPVSGRKRKASGPGQEEPAKRRDGEAVWERARPLAAAVDRSAELRAWARWQRDPVVPLVTEVQGPTCDRPRAGKPVLFNKYWLAAVRGPVRVAVVAPTIHELPDYSSDEEEV